MKRLRVALFVVFSLQALGCAGSGELGASTMLGVWVGEVTEGDVNYDLNMAIVRLDVGQEAGTATYSGSFDCVGTLTFLGEREGVFSFREDIDDATVCADNGEIVVWRDEDGTLRWEWFRTDTEARPDAIAILRRRA